jgi:hypothetical protein
MRGLDPRIPIVGTQCPPKRDGRDKPGHDDTIKLGHVPGNMLSGYEPGAYRTPLSDDIRRELVFDEGDAVAQLQLALLEALNLDDIGAG